MPAEAAVEVHRELAKANPDAFRPDLAMSFGAMSQVLDGSERHGEAAAVLTEGVQIPRPPFETMPQAFAPSMGALARDYLKAAGAAKIAPDMELLGPVVAVFERLEKEQAENGTGRE